MNQILNHIDLGEWGEMVAIDYLKEKNYYIMSHDWRLKHKDIDIIAFDNSTKEVVFVEVKTRRNNVFLEPEEAVTYQKIKNIKSAANAYILYYKVSQDIRFDIIAVIGTDDTNVQIRHTENAF